MDLKTFIAMDDEVQDDFLAQAAHRVLELPGIFHSFNPDLLVEADLEDDEDQIYMKFMSDGGHSDEQNGLILHSYLRSKNIKFDSTAQRNVIMKMSDFLTLFGED